MAAQPLDVVAQIVLIPATEIRVGDRLRPVDPLWADALGAIMKAEGQKTPIEVCRLPGDTHFTLVSGAHRLKGAILHAIIYLKAEIVTADALERRTREISENLWRQGLSPIDRATFIAELVALKKRLAGIDPTKDGRAVSAAVRWQKALRADAVDATDIMSVAYGWTAELAEQIGVTERTVRRDLALYCRLLPDAAARLRGNPIASNSGQVQALAKLSAEDQRAVVELLLAGDARTVPDALGIIQQKPKPDPQTKAWSAFFGGWSRMSAAMRRDALRELQNQGLPRGVTIKFGGDSDQ